MVAVVCLVEKLVKFGIPSKLLAKPRSTDASTWGPRSHFKAVLAVRPWCLLETTVDCIYVRRVGHCKHQVGEVAVRVDQESFPRRQGDVAPVLVIPVTRVSDVLWRRVNLIIN